MTIGSDARMSGDERTPPTITLQSLHVGRVAPLGSHGVASAFLKHPVRGRLPVTTLGIAGDEQADLTVHGGSEKAVYGYALDHYGAWRTDFPEHEAILRPGGFGENLTISGLEESGICVGDVHRIGTATLQICQPRQPCFKLALRFGDNRLPKAMIRTGRAGWYYRVLEEGSIQAGDEVTLADRPSSAFPFPRLVSIVNLGKATPDELAAMSRMPELASSLRAAAAKALMSLDPT